VNMKQQKQGQRTFLRASQIAIASAAFALLAACGGGGSSDPSDPPAGGVSLQVVSFGDSLSDVGTYSPNITIGYGGGKFTTNPGNIWVQDVAQYYGGTITPAYEGGFGLPLTATGGLGYAQGGADVLVAQGVGYAPNNAAETTVPVATQVSEYISAHSSFSANQLVLINGGANDIFQTLQDPTAMATLEATITTAETYAVENSLTAAQTQAYVVGQVAAALQSGNMQLYQAATTLATQVGTIVKAGAVQVAVMNVPDIGQTPMGYQEGLANASAPLLLSAITAAYNAILQESIIYGLTGSMPATPPAAGSTSWKLPTGQQVIWVDAFNWLDTDALPNAAANGFTVTNTDTACNVGLMQANALAFANANPSVLAGGLTPSEYSEELGQSLFCSPATLTVPNAATTYMFADTVHPTTALHAVFAKYVETQLAAAGIGNAPQ
jgi:phospholipase/lecithinase/hemolysin